MRATLLCLTLALAAISPLQAQRAFEPPDKALHSQRRANFLNAMDGGIGIIVAAIEDQNRIYEFFVDHSDLHDFIYLTGLEAATLTGRRSSSHPTPRPTGRSSIRPKIRRRWRA